ncbi:MAG TPA: NDP-sugar synthase [Spirochaetota bacterium]|nr:NDP-sugar synthase [Spirochaetota bacterium]
MDLDIARLIDAHRSSGAIATVVLYRHPGDPTVAQVGVRGSEVVDFKNFLGTGVESGLVYTGAAVLSPAIFRYLEDGFSSVVYTAYVEIIQRRGLSFFTHGGYWHDIGSPASLHDVNMRMLEREAEVRTLMEVLPGVEVAAVSGGAAIAREALVERSVVGDGCAVGSGAVVRNSVLLPGARVAEGRVIENALVLGDGVIN